MALETTHHPSVLADSVLVTHDLLSKILTSIDGNELHDLESDIGRFVHLTTLMARLVREPADFKLKVKNSHIKLLIILKGMVSARQKQDQLVLEELIKYELKDNFTQWKIELIPQIKKISIQ